MKVYVPDNNYKCVVVLDKDTIRGYKDDPLIGNNVDYDDIYIHSDYYIKSDSHIIQEIPTCLDSTEITHSYYYRIDFLQILCIFCILSLLCFGVPLKIFSRLLGRRIK